MCHATRDQPTARIHVRLELAGDEEIEEKPQHRSRELHVDVRVEEKQEARKYGLESEMNGLEVECPRL